MKRRGCLVGIALALLLSVITVVTGWMRPVVDTGGSSLSVKGTPYPVVTIAPIKGTPWAVVPTPIPAKTIMAGMFSVQEPPTYTEVHGTLPSGEDYIQMMSANGQVIIRIQTLKQSLSTADAVIAQVEEDAGAVRATLTSVGTPTPVPMFGQTWITVSARYTASDGTPMEAAEYSLYPYASWFSAPVSEWNDLIGNLWEVTMQTVVPVPKGP